MCNLNTAPSTDGIFLQRLIYRMRTTKYNDNFVFPKAILLHSGLIPEGMTPVHVDVHVRARCSALTPNRLDAAEVET